MSITSKTAAELKAEREALNKQIRAAERAEREAAKAALRDAQHALGEWLAEELKAATPEAVGRLREAVDLDHVRARLAGPGVTETGTGDDASGEEDVVGFSTAQDRDEEAYLHAGVAPSGY